LTLQYKAKPAARQGQKVADPDRSQESRTAEGDTVKVARGGSAFSLAGEKSPANVKIVQWNPLLSDN
jgi:uncharacterized Zn-binding protein involved in type VI secretion